MRPTMWAEGRPTLTGCRCRCGFRGGVLARVDRVVAARRAENPIPRTTWLLDAVNEKLAREEKGDDDE